MKLILASQSPRRRKLLAEAGFVFDVRVFDTAEISGGIYSLHVPLLNAIRKAEAAAEHFPGDLVIGADTVIEFNGAIIGKPRDLSDARCILRTLSGRCHLVITGVALQCRELNVKIGFSVESTVEFKQLDESAIDRYLAHVEVLDKAGAYNIDEYGDILIQRVEGPIDNIIGLPCEKLSQALNSPFIKSRMGLMGHSGTHGSSVS